MYPIVVLLPLVITFEVFATLWKLLFLLELAPDLKGETRLLLVFERLTPQQIEVIVEKIVATIIAILIAYLTGWKTKRLPFLKVSA